MAVSYDEALQRQGEMRKQEFAPIERSLDERLILGERKFDVTYFDDWVLEMIESRYGEAGWDVSLEADLRLGGNGAESVIFAVFAKRDDGGEEE